jgi:hypothetical protein
MGDSSKKTPKT